MYGIFIQFEQSASFLNPMVLLGFGTLGILIGIVLWLGGAIGGRFSVGLVVLMLGILAGLCFFAFTAALIIGVIVAVLAMVFKRLFTGLTASILVMLLVVNGFQLVTGSQSQIETTESWTIQPSEDGPMSVQASLQVLKDMIQALGRAGIHDVQSVSLIRHLNVLGLFAAVGILCWLIRPMGIALCCATAGTLLIVSGLVLTLSYKGAQPVSYINTHATYAVCVAGIMSVFGTLEQLLFCRRASKRPAAKPTDKSKT